MMYFTSGGLYKFKYNGGENPGAERIVYVLSTGKGTFSGFCFTRKEARTFSLSKCSDQEFVSDYICIELENMPTVMQDGKILSKNYADEGYSCYVGNGLLIAVKVPTKSSVVMAFGFKNCIKVIKNGKSKFIYITGQTAEELIQDLSAIG